MRLFAVNYVTLQTEKEIKLLTMVDMNKKIIIGSDHAGFELKELMKNWLNEMGYEVKDCGTYSIDSVDYPDFAHPTSKGVNDGEFARGIVVCGSGEGVSMVANKYPNVRCGLVYNTEVAKLIRQHNDANMAAFPARFVSEDMAKEMLELFLNTEFEGGRHCGRVNKIAIK